jgi:hypothetical protein
MTDEATAETPIEEVSLATLYAMQEIASGQAALAKARTAVVQAELERRLGASAKAAYDQAGKEHGTLSLPLQGGLMAKLDVTKKVEWDSEKLLKLAQTMPWERVTAMFKIVFAVSETTYKGIAVLDGDLKAKIDDARTVKFGQPKIVLVREG